MTLQEIIEAVDALSPDDMRQVRQHIEQKEHKKSQEPKLQAGTMDADALFRAFDEIRAGFTEEELDEVEEVMNAEYIEPLDESEWE